VWVNEHGETTVPGLYAAGDMACVPHNYLLGALTYGQICADSAAVYAMQADLPPVDGDQVEIERKRIVAPLSRPTGIPHHQYEYKVRRLVNDYLQPPKTVNRMTQGLEYFTRLRDELDEVGATNPHEMMRAVECSFIRDCAEMAARASLFRTESRWGLYHYRLDYPEMNDAEWFVHVNLRKGPSGEMELFKRPVDPYIVPMTREELSGYRSLRVPGGDSTQLAPAAP
jgi:succinate dehydrogenase/fumarate reductase flavoprotein subunit